MPKKRSILDFPRNEAGLVDEFIGTAYDAMYAIYQNLDALLAVNLNMEEALKAAERAGVSALEAKAQADRAQKIVDDFEASGNFADFRTLGIYTAQFYGLVGGATKEESLAINKAIDACGKAGGGVVYVRAKNDGDPIYLNKPVQIEYDNVVLQFDSPILYGPKGTMRVSGNYKEIRRTELGQTDLIALLTNSTVDEVGEMQFTVRPGEGRFLVAGDRVTLRGENDATGNALEKQTVTIKSIVGDVISCYDVPELTFKAIYPDSEWEPDKTTGTTVSIVNYSAFTANTTGPNVLDVTVEDGSKFQVGELVYVSDARKERDLIQERDLVSAAVMEHAVIAKITGNVITFDKPLQRQYLRTFKGGISSLKAIFNSHIRIKELGWSAPQPDRKNSCIGINFGWKCSIKFDKMEGRTGRVGTAMRIAYSFDCEMFESEIHGGLSHASAESYGAVMYYSTFCRIRNSFATGSRHNYLIQTCVSCDILDNISTDDYISGIDLHGAGALNCRIMGNRISRSKQYAPDSSIGGGIRNGNTSHVIGDHGTLIYNNYIEGYNNRNDSNGLYQSAAIDVSPASQNVIVRDNHMVDCSIGFRHYRISPSITVQRVTNRIILIGNTFERISEKLIEMSLGSTVNTLVQELVLIDNKSVNNAKQFEINDVPKVRLINNQIIAPQVAAGVYGFSVTKCPDLVAVGNFAVEANRGFRIADCPGAKVFKNVLDLTREDVPFTASGSNNVGYVERGNTLADSGGSGATIQIGTVTTGVPGSDAQVTNSGTAQDAIFNFVIPRGAPGTGGGSGGDYSPGVNVQALDAMVGQVQRILYFNASGQLAQLNTGAEGRAVLALATTDDLKDRLGVSQVNNTPDMEKPVSTAMQEALGNKADINGPVFTGRPMTPNPAMPLNPAYAQQAAPAQWTLDQIAAAIAAMPSPSGNTTKMNIALLGDSLSSNNSLRGRWHTRGFLTWAQFLTSYKLDTSQALNKGVFGNTSTQIAARVSEITALKPDICLVEMGGNDVTQTAITIETMKANVDSVVAALTDAGITVLLCTIYPVANASSGTHYAKLMAFNQYIRTLQGYKKLVEVIDAYSICMDKTSPNKVNTAYTYDGTHPGCYGAYLLGRELAKSIEKMATRYSAPLLFTDRLDVAGIGADTLVPPNTLGNVFTNGLLEGTAGTLSGTGVSGVVPDGWTLDGTLSRGMTVVASAVAATVDQPAGIKFTLGGTVTASSADQSANAGVIYLGQMFGGTTDDLWRNTNLGKHFREKTFDMNCYVEYKNLVGIGGAGPAVHGWDSGDATGKGIIGVMVMSNEQNFPGAKGSVQSLLMPSGEFKGPLQIINEDMEKISRGVRPGFYIFGIPGQAVSGEIIIRQMNLKRHSAV